jgi:aspartate dehydrogenase
MVSPPHDKRHTALPRSRHRTARLPIPPLASPLQDGSKRRATELNQRIKPRAALIGFGAIGRTVAAHWPADRGVLAAVLVRPMRLKQARAALPHSVAVVDNLHALLSLSPDLVAECAGHAALREFGPAILRSGADLMAIATGALAEDRLRTTLIAAARQGGGRVLLPSGAIAGLDGLAAMRVGGIDRVRYVSVKPPEAWRGTAAERIIDLAHIAMPTAFFQGSAREAARLFPQNANLAATVALAGIGLDRTEIALIADPGATGNTGRIQAEGRHATLDVTVGGPAAEGNPKTSAITALSIVQAIACGHTILTLEEDA